MALLVLLVILLNVWGMSLLIERVIAGPDPQEQSGLERHGTWVAWVKEGAARLVFALVLALFTACHWVPLLASIFLSLEPFKSMQMRIRCAGYIVCAVTLGLVSWGYWYLTGIRGFLTSIRAWSTGSVPEFSRGCEIRVLRSQAPLFLPATYNAQFARICSDFIQCRWNHEFKPAFNQTVFNSIRADRVLCDRGFSGNTDLYGLGIRIGLYLQWISSLLANNLLSQSREELQKVYLVFHLAIYFATVIASFVKTCVFSIEIEILYWMYWRGFLCVFGSSPCPLQLGKETRWVQLNWSSVFLFVTHDLMSYHAMWFVWHAYDQTFARMPCGTYHFFFAPMLDPSESFWALRDWLTMVINPVFVSVGLLFPLLVILLAAEVKHAIQHSTVYETYFGKPIPSDYEQASTDQTDNETVEIEQRENAECKSLRIRSRVYQVLKHLYEEFRLVHGFPSHSRSGIRLVTPIDVRNRRTYRIRWAILGLLSFVITVLAIELTMKWNKIVGVDSIASTGQCVPLIVGVASFASVCWNLIYQEAERRERLRRRQSMNEDEEGVELNTLTSAISHAFSQPDVGFLTNDGALPISSEHEESSNDAGALIVRQTWRSV